MPKLNFGSRWIGGDQPTYFIADIAANHDGDLERARELIHLAANAGANAAKFQNFRAEKIVSERGFASLKQPLSHQSTWSKSVYEVYQDATVPWDWTAILKRECDAAGIDYLSTPYDLEAVDMLDPHVSVFKIGSGDITWPEMFRAVAGKAKPVILSTGASNIWEVCSAVDLLRSINPQLVLLQCNTNYEVSAENFKHVHLNVLKTYGVMFPDVVLGLSDHTIEHSAVLGAVALGARVVEKHFTDDTSREGPDHPFSLTPDKWREMVDRTRELELALGDPAKRVTENELQTVIVQRRCLRASRNLTSGTIITREMIDVLRPAPSNSILPYYLDQVVGMRLNRDLTSGEYFTWPMLDNPDE